MNEELKKTVRAVQGMEQYDESVKQVLAHKIILANILVNIEAQKDEPTSYYIQNRAVFYACRMVSSQKERDFTGMNYNDIKKVYTIWICMNQKENSLNYLHLTNEKLMGKTAIEKAGDFTDALAEPSGCVVLVISKVRITPTMLFAAACVETKFPRE